MLAISETSLDHVLHSDGVEGRHHNLVERLLDVNFVLWHSIEPVDPALALELLIFGPLDLPLIIINKALLREVHDTSFGKSFSEPLVELFSTSESGGCSDGPDKAENEEIRDLSE